MHPPLQTPPDAATAAGEPAPLAVDAASEGSTAPRRRGPVRRWLGRLVSLVATLAVLGIAGVALAVTAVPAAVHGHALTVLSGSMVPEFSPGAMVVDRPATASSLRAGDVVTYATTDETSGAPILITHRIVEVTSGPDGPVFTTKGDANNAPDDRPVSASQVRGKVWYSVPYIGQARNFLLAQGAGMIIAGVVGLLLAAWLVSWALRSDRPTDDAEAGAARGRHRVRNVGAGAVLVGLLATGSQLGSQDAGSYAQFSDQQSIDFQIGIGSPASSTPPGKPSTAPGKPSTAPGKPTTLPSKPSTPPGKPTTPTSAATTPSSAAAPPRAAATRGVPAETATATASVPTSAPAKTSDASATSTAPASASGTSAAPGSDPSSTP